MQYPKLSRLSCRYDMGKILLAILPGIGIAIVPSTRIDCAIHELQEYAFTVFMDGIAC